MQRNWCKENANEKLRSVEEVEEVNEDAKKRKGSALQCGHFILLGH